ncbi:MAG: hypothetical protein Q9167_002527 [Letrouitia subvulpina]
MDCTTTGDGDFYGLGVRLGLYLQWAAGFCLRNSSGSWKMISTVRTTNNALCGAIVLAVVINTARGTALSTDYLIVYYLTVALFYSESYNLLTKGEREGWGEKSYYVLEPDVPLLVQNLLFAFNHLFGAWFWIRGLHHTQPTTCPPKAALLGPFDLYDKHWMKFAATAAIIGGINFLIFFAIHLYAFWNRSLAGGPVTKVAYVLSDCCGPSIPPVDIVRELLRPGFRSDLNELWDKVKMGDASSLQTTVGIFLAQSGLLIHFALVNLVGPVIAIVSVERMLHANHLTTPRILDSSGQMIALLTGATSLIAALWELGKGFFGIGRNSETDLLALQLYQSRKLLDSHDIKVNSQKLSEENATAG